MVVVFGGVGNLAGTFVGAITLGVINKFLEPVAGAVLGKVVVLVADHPLHPAAAARPVRPQGPHGGGLRVGARLLSPPGWVAFAAVAVVLLVGVPVLNGGLPESSALHLPNYLVPLLGKYVCFALLALSSTWSGATPASSSWAMAPSSPSAATPWACT